MNTYENKKIINLLNPVKTIAGIWQYRDLLKQLAKQNILGRYKGSGLVQRKV